MKEVKIDMIVKTEDFGEREFKKEIEKLINDIDPETKIIDFSMREVGNERRSISQYMNHLNYCNKMQDWSEVADAFSDTPEQFRDEGYYQALEEMQQKSITCTCGLESILSKLK